VAGLFGLQKNNFVLTTIAHPVIKMEAILVYVCMAMAIAVIALIDDLKQKGYNPKSVDRDHDGFIQEGTRFERKKGKWLF